MRATPREHSINFSTDVVLPFGSVWSVDVIGSDLAELSFPDAFRHLVVLGDPGLFEQNDFESSPKALLGSGASVVRSLGTLGAISGEHSLLLSPGSFAIFHLARPAGANRVRFKARVLSSALTGNEFGTEFPRGAAVAAVIRGTVRNSVKSKQRRATRPGATRAPFKT